MTTTVFKKIKKKLLVANDQLNTKSIKAMVEFILNEKEAY